MGQCQFQVMIRTPVQSSYSTTIQCNITSEDASVAECDKNITTEIDFKLISHGSLYCWLFPLQKLNTIISEEKTSRKLS